MYNEFDVLNQLRHKKLIALHDAFETDDTLGLILELGAGGELVPDYLLKTDYYTESDIAGFIRQLLQGLEYMHGRGYAHMGLNVSFSLQRDSFRLLSGCYSRVSQQLPNPRLVSHDFTTL